MECSVLTKKGKPCPHNADRFNNGRWYCHVHDPRGLYQMQVAANRAERARVKAGGGGEADGHGPRRWLQWNPGMWLGLDAQGCAWVAWLV